tara:strand:- start:387 stop:785 length:399 start_codon:yes stop_codon:yes gene_type:complete
MRLQNTLWIVIAIVVCGSCGNVWAYGDSGSDSSHTNACSNVRFSAFTPSNKTKVAPESPFSFLASGGTYPKSITVTIKGQSVPITVTPKNDGFQVTGMLPATLKGSFARINITAKGSNKCERSDGWLLKVTS